MTGGQGRSSRDHKRRLRAIRDLHTGEVESLIGTDVDQLDEFRRIRRSGGIVMNLCNTQEVLHIGCGDGSRIRIHLGSIPRDECQRFPKIRQPAIVGALYKEPLSTRGAFAATHEGGNIGAEVERTTCGDHRSSREIVLNTTLNAPTGHIYCRIILVSKFDVFLILSTCRIVINRSE